MTDKKIAEQDKLYKEAVLKLQSKRLHMTDEELKIETAKFAYRWDNANLD